MSRRINTALVRHRRETLGLRLLDVAEAVGIDISAASRWENGLTMPTFAHGLAWARVLDLNPEDLLTDEATS